MYIIREVVQAGLLERGWHAGTASDEGGLIGPLQHCSRARHIPADRPGAAAPVAPNRLNSTIMYCDSSVRVSCQSEPSDVRHVPLKSVARRDGGGVRVTDRVAGSRRSAGSARTDAWAPLGDCSCAASQPL
jgi:hypothetical protein